jgi:PAS domain S-box-containing protein
MSHHQIRILLVDDDPDFADLTKTALEREDDRFVVETATDAVEGLQSISDRPPDCVVSDYTMPDMDGIEFLKTVRKEHPDLPFILFTGKGSEAVAGEAIAADVTDYLQKGGGTSHYAVLANRISNAVEAAQSATEAEQRRHRLEQILKTVPACVVQIDVDGQFVFANQHAEEVLGLDTDELTQRAYNDPEWELQDVNGESIPDEKLPFRQVRDAGEPIYDATHRITWPDGSQKTLSVNAAPVFDETGDVESVVASLNDITDRRERQRELGLLQQSIDNANVPITLADPTQPDNPLIYVNDAFEAVTGYSPEEAVGRNCRFLQGADTEPEKSSALRQAIDNEEPATVELRNYRKDGTEFWNRLTVTPIHDDDDELVRYLGTQEDVTDRKEREEQLSRLHEATRELFDADSPKQVAEIASQAARSVLKLPLNGIHFYDDSAGGLKPVAVSEASQELFGDVPTINDGVALETFQRGELEIYDDVHDASNVYNPETPIRSEMVLPLGEYGVFMISSQQVGSFDDADIKLAQTLAANTETALERTSREQELQTQKEQLTLHNERLEEFASIISHDLRNPLQVAETRLELIRQECESAHIDDVAQALDRMDALIGDVLTLAREGEQVDETKPVGLANVAQNSWQTVDTEQAVLETNTLRTVEADRSRLRQLFENLYRNAVEHGGEEMVVSVGAMDDGFYVTDTGPGIPESDREKIFRAGYSTSTDGTGFGLRIVKQVANAHGWEVTVTESEQGGARFKFTGVQFVE